MMMKANDHFANAKGGPTSTSTTQRASACVDTTDTTWQQSSSSTSDSNNNNNNSNNSNSTSVVNDESGMMLLGCAAAAEEANTILAPRARVVSCLASLMSSAMHETSNGIELPLREFHEQLPLLFTTQHQQQQRNCNDLDSFCLKVPSLLLKREANSSYSSEPEFVMGRKPTLQDAAANQLRKPLYLKPNELIALPDRLLFNISKSFMSLVDSRVRSCLSALLRQLRAPTRQPGELHRRRVLSRALTTLLGGGNTSVRSPTSTRFLTGAAAASAAALEHATNKAPINPRTVVANFKTIQTDIYEDENEDERDPVTVLPLVLEAVFDLDILDHLTPVRFEVPGTISATFVPVPDDDEDDEEQEENAKGLDSSMLFHSVEIMLDTDDLLRAMMEQARNCARQAVNQAIQIALGAINMPQDYLGHVSMAMDACSSCSPMVVASNRSLGMLTTNQKVNGMIIIQPKSSDLLNFEYHKIRTEYATISQVKEGKDEAQKQLTPENQVTEQVPISEEDEANENMDLTSDDQGNIDEEDEE